MRRALALAAALALIAAPAALADGDPASDILPRQDAFYPYQPPASKSLVEALDKLLKQVRAAGYPMKVAMIESASDLGSYPQLFNNPQEYANLLASELPTQRDQKVTDEFHLLVVMPGGFGGQHLGDKVDSALGPVKIDASAQSDGLVRAALEAVARIATAAGHPTKVPPEASPPGSSGGGGSGGGGSAGLIIGIVAGVLVVAGAAGFALRRRQGGPGSDERPPEPPPAQDAA